MKSNTEIMLGLVIASFGLIIVFYIIKKFSEQLQIFVRDTMKEKQSDGTWKWSKTALTMASAWYSCLYAFFFDLIKNGFNFEAFMVMAGVGTGVGVAAAYAKKLNPLVQEPKDNGATGTN